MYNYQVYCLYSDSRGFKIFNLKANSKLHAEHLVSQVNLVSVEVQYISAA